VAVHTQGRNLLGVLLRRLAREVGRVVLRSDLQFDVCLYLRELLDGAFVLPIRVVLEDGAKGGWVVLKGHLDKRKPVEKGEAGEVAAQGAGIVESVVSNADVDIKLTATVFDALHDFAERTHDGDHSVLGDFVTDEIRGRGLGL
jgi:hypothetical protein